MACHMTLVHTFVCLGQINLIVSFSVLSKTTNVEDLQETSTGLYSTLRNIIRVGYNISKTS